MTPTPCALLVHPCSCKRSTSREYGTKPVPLPSVELEDKARDYVNDTEVGGQPPPLYAPVLGKVWAEVQTAVVM